MRKLDFSRRSSRILNLLWKHGSLSKYDLMKMTRYSASSVTSAVDQMLGAGWIVQNDPVVVGAGRPPIPLSIRPDAAYAVGASFHAGSVMATVCDLRQAVLTQATRPVRDPNDRSEILRDVSSAIEQVIAEIGESKILGIGIGAPGTVDAARGVGKAYCYMPGWINVPVRDFFEVAFGLPVAVENNIRTAAFGESIAGVARDRNPVVFIGGSTGIGAGIVMNGRIYVGRTGLAGEVGHMTVERSGPKCRCGKRGCLECMVSTPAVVSRVARSVAQGENRTADELLCGGFGIERVWVLSAAGDERVLAELQDVADYIAVGCINVKLMFDPEMIVLGGDFVRGGEQLLQWVCEGMKRASGSVEADRTQVVMSALGDQASAIGASCLAIQSATGMFSPGSQEV